MLLHRHVLSEMKKGRTFGLKLRLWTDTGFRLAPKHLITSRYSAINFLHFTYFSFSCFLFVIFFFVSITIDKFAGSW